MTSPFWNGFEKRADAVVALKGAARTARTFGKGLLIGGGLVGAGIGMQNAASTPSVAPLQQGY